MDQQCNLRVEAKPLASLLAAFHKPKNAMIEALIHRIKIRQAELQIAMAAGAPFNWETYQRMVGEHMGLQASMDMIDAMLEEEKNQD